MEERIVQVPTADGRMETFITHPEQGGPFAAVVLFMDVWGIREELCDIARRIGTVGYCAVCPTSITARAGCGTNSATPTTA